MSHATSMVPLPSMLCMKLPNSLGTNTRKIGEEAKGGGVKGGGGGKAVKTAHCRVSFSALANRGAVIAPCKAPCTPHCKDRGEEGKPRAGSWGQVSG
jgi:hypothetical protein